MEKIDDTGVPDMAERQEAVRLFNAYSEAAAEVDELEHGRSDTGDVLDNLFAAYQDEIRQARDRYDAERARLVGPAMEAAQARMTEAKNAYEAHQSPAIREDNDGNATYCAKSGAPLYEDDEVLEDVETGEVVLRSLVLGPRPDEFADDEDSEIEEAA